MPAGNLLAETTAHVFDIRHYRNIVSLRVSEDLFDDLSDDPVDRHLAQSVEIAHKAGTLVSGSPIIDRPFEETAWDNAVGYPFQHFTASRFSAGSFGVWYGGDCVETTVHETVYHWVHHLLDDAGYRQPGIALHRKVYALDIDGVLFDFRRMVDSYPALIDPTSYAMTQAVGMQLSRLNSDGLITQSARYRAGECSAVLRPQILSNPQFACYLTYRTTTKGVTVERTPDEIWLRLDQP